jgi:surface protein
MKTINTYINEKLRLTAKQKYTYQPKDKNALRRIIRDRIKDEGNECYLNDIDTSKITDMSYLLDASDLRDFNGDVSMWDVSNVTNMQGMFLSCEQFNCDLSEWNVSNVNDMRNMFWRCKNFNCDISKWDVSNVKDMFAMFYECEKFRRNLNGWDVSNVENMNFAFEECPTQPKWYKDK